MSEDERPTNANLRLGPVDTLRYGIIDILESRRGRWVAAIVFGATWGLLAVWFGGWGVVGGWIPAAALAVSIGYVCR